MTELCRELNRVVPIDKLLGYLNFSEGRPDPRFQKQISDSFSFLDGKSQDTWKTFADCLQQSLKHLRETNNALRDADQAEAVLQVTFDKVLPAYREHHADLLFHQSDADLFQPFFLARVFEAVLTTGGPWDEDERLVKNTLRRLNDYVGHRPIAVLESRPKSEPYDHEGVRPVPLFICEAGCASGRYQSLLEITLEVLRQTNADVMRDAYFDLERLDELAFDPRGYDFGHPADKRPNYCFGEWDARNIDNSGFYRRFVLRQIVLDGLMHRLEHSQDASPDELLWEAGAVLAGIILMASGVSGAGPDSHDSSVTLSTLIPVIARVREVFYAQLLDKVTGELGDRLRKEAERYKQPFALVRRQLNNYLAEQRAFQLQQRHLAMLFSEIGDTEAARRQARPIPVASVRMLTEIHTRLTAADHHLDRGEVAEAAVLLPEAEDLLHRAIRCGAMVDPWNVLGFQGNYPRFPAIEDTIHDPRVDQLVHTVDRLFNLYARVISEQSATGTVLPASPATALRRLAEWWDQFATLDVSDIQNVNGREVVESADHVATTLALWRKRNEATADLAFWRDHLEGFQSPKAYALVVDALLQKEDFQASMALLMTWLGHAEEVALEEGDFSFHTLSLRWMLGWCNLIRDQRVPESATPFGLIVKFFDYLEANAEDYWLVPNLETLTTDYDDEIEDEIDDEDDEDDEEDIYSAAYEDVVYRDTTDDDIEGEVLDIMPEKDFSLKEEADRLEDRLHFISSVARLWSIASRCGQEIRLQDGDSIEESRLAEWYRKCLQNGSDLLNLLDSLQDHEVPKPSGTYESMLDYDQHRGLKDHLLNRVIATCMDTALAAGALRGLLGESQEPDDADRPAWELSLLRIEKGLWRGDADKVRDVLPEFREQFHKEPLLITPLEHGGSARLILRAGMAQIILRGLVANLPRIGLLRETLDFVHTAYQMEKNQDLPGQKVTEFDRLFRTACQSVTDAVMDAAEDAGLLERNDHELVTAVVPVLKAVRKCFTKLWLEHSQTLRVSMVESLSSETEWASLKDFIREYGHDLFSARFMTPANLRGILHRGIGPFFDDLEENADPLHPVKLIEDLDAKISRAEAERHLQFLLPTILENYEEYKDYNATTTQSDYGENLYQWLDFLRLKAKYQRFAWEFRPWNLVHEVLARRHAATAAHWRKLIIQRTRRLADELIEKLSELEHQYGMRLRTISDRLEERFVKPLDLDRLCALIEPAVKQVKQEGAPKEPTELERALEPYAKQPTGVGLDVPQWLRRLEEEVQQVQNAETPLAHLADSIFKIPKIKVPLAKIRSQLEGGD